MATWIARFDSNGLIPPLASVAGMAVATVVAAALGWVPGTWREITDAEAADLQRPTLEEARIATIARIDAETSAAILAGFAYEIEGRPLHFSYGTNDQQNFADTANAATLARLGVLDVPESVTWNGWDIARGETGGEVSRTLVRLALTPESFLALYMDGALAHKAAHMERGGWRKEAAERAQSVEELEGI